MLPLHQSTVLWSRLESDQQPIAYQAIALPLSYETIAEGVGFEPTAALHHSRFRDECLKPDSAILPIISAERERFELSMAFLPHYISSVAVSAAHAPLQFISVPEDGFEPP